MDRLRRARMQFWIATGATIVIAITTQLIWGLPIVLSAKKPERAVLVDGFLIMTQYAAEPESTGQVTPQRIVVNHRSWWYWHDWLPTLAIHSYVNGDYVNWRLDFPLWPLVLPSAFVAYRSLRTVRRLSRAGCKHCGYSRAGLAADAPCPECGRVR